MSIGRPALASWGRSVPEPGRIRASGHRPYIEFVSEGARSHDRRLGSARSIAVGEDGHRVELWEHIGDLPTDGRFPLPPCSPRHYTGWTVPSAR